MAASKGGMFNTPTATFSKETQELLKVMMQESKLTNFQQRKLSENIQNGRDLPLKCGPTSTATKGPARAQPKSKKARTPGAGGKRSKDSIESRKKDDPDDYQPPLNGYNSHKEKSRLQSIMTFGEDLDSKQPAQPPSPQPADTVEPEVDRFDEILQEIEDRKQFLRDMEAVGQAHAYQNMIHTEISQKIRELELLDKQRCKALAMAS